MSNRDADDTQDQNTCRCQSLSLFGHGPKTCPGSAICTECIASSRPRIPLKPDTIFIFGKVRGSVFLLLLHRKTNQGKLRVGLPLAVKITDTLLPVHITFRHTLGTEGMGRGKTDAQRAGE
ncbi:hypothetical protein BaRGS_00010239 [Batillaria attramentaria]|uniref:Uncharacterized protein n=1 Tax=Batillaria attramentaria TaxID=370345 RepID=A0ABD0LHU5_9CAEN